MYTRWRELQRLSAAPLSELPIEGTHALLELLAIADQASSGAGIPLRARRSGETPKPEDEPDEFYLEATRLLARPGTSSLCRDIDISRAVVLPKMHTPQLGMSLRSLSHHLALCEPGEVSPRWGTAPQALEAQAVNLLVFPWPLEVVPTLFRPNRGHLANMDDKHFRFFTCETSPSLRAQLARIPALLEEAERIAGPVHALVFPELSLPSGEAVALSERLRKIVIAGEGTPSNGETGDPGTNQAVVAVPSGPLMWATTQAKHHRWRLDGRQIEQYGLGSRLDPNCAWWEHIALGPRELRFWCLDDWFTFCVLICEDLARQEPVAPMVRAVGPNLVLALVMDGPQLDKRWTARYATVLADDPGSSVLALTSAGMARLSRLPGKPPSRVVALWKDGRGGTPLEISLDDGAEAIVLCLTQSYDTEWTADGRDDDAATGYVRLHGTHQVRAPGTAGQ